MSDPAAHSLHGLEVLASLAVALNLAYLNLPKFQTVEIMSRIAKDHRDDLTHRNGQNLSGFTWFRQLSSLADIEMSPDRLLGSGKQQLIDVPNAWGFWLNLLFIRPIGRNLAVASTAYGLLIVLLASAYGAHAVSTGENYFGRAAYGYLWPLVAATLWPLFVISMGTYVKSGFAEFLRTNTDETEAAAFQDAANEVSKAVAETPLPDPPKYDPERRPPIDPPQQSA